MEKSAHMPDIIHLRLFLFYFIIAIPMALYLGGIFTTVSRIYMPLPGALLGRALYLFASSQLFTGVAKVKYTPTYLHTCSK